MNAYSQTAPAVSGNGYIVKGEIVLKKKKKNRPLARITSQYRSGKIAELNRAWFFENGEVCRTLRQTVE